MNPPASGLQSDIDFLKALASDSGRLLRRDAITLVAVGMIFGVNAVLTWAIFAGYLPQPRSMWLWPYMGALVLFLAVVLLTNRRFRSATDGAASRAMSTAWSSVGVTLTVAGVALALASWRLAEPRIMYLFPIVLFAIYGAAWWIAFSVKHVTWYRFVTAGCFATVLAIGFVAGSPAMWLVLACGLFLFVGVPGLLLLRETRAEV